MDISKSTYLFANIPSLMKKINSKLLQYKFKQIFSQIIYTKNLFSLAWVKLIISIGQFITGAQYSKVQQ